MHRSDDGFTLIELLVVMLVIGVLASIALPVFLTQRDKASDAEAKSNARNLVSHMEACYHQNETYVGCGVQLTADFTGLPVGTGVGEVSVTNETTVGYKLTSTSRAEEGGVNHAYVIDHTVGSTYVQTCTPQGVGGCSAAGDW